MATALLHLKPVPKSFALTERVYEELKRAIVGLDFYEYEAEPRLGERRLAEDFGVSRTPVRWALHRLEN